MGKPKARRLLLASDLLLNALRGRKLQSQSASSRSLRIPKTKSKDSLDKMNAESLQLRAIAHADSVTFNVMRNLGFEHAWNQSR